MIDSSASLPLVVFPCTVPLLILAQPFDIELPVNSIAVLRVEASGNDLFYQWFIFSEGRPSVLSDSPDYSGTNTATLLVSISEQEFFGIFFVRVSNPTESVDSNSAVLNLCECLYSLAII